MTTTTAIREKKILQSVDEKDILSDSSNDSEFDSSVPTTPRELKQRRKRFGVCLSCGNPLSDKSWCQLCEGLKLQRKFNNWTSGDPSIDNFIQSSQMKPLSKDSYLLWVPYEDLIQVRYMANGGFSAVYSALWDHFETGKVVEVVLKRLHNGQTSDPEFLREQVRLPSQLYSFVHHFPMIPPLKLVYHVYRSQCLYMPHPKNLP